MIQMKKCMSVSKMLKLHSTNFTISLYYIHMNKLLHRPFNTILAKAIGFSTSIQIQGRLNSKGTLDNCVGSIVKSF